MSHSGSYTSFPSLCICRRPGVVPVTQPRCLQYVLTCFFMNRHLAQIWPITDPSFSLSFHPCSCWKPCMVLLTRLRIDEACTRSRWVYACKSVAWPIAIYKTILTHACLHKTIGDCYVAATGLPQPRRDHHIAMCRFAVEMREKFKELRCKLEVKLGPDTGDLSLR